MSKESINFENVRERKRKRKREILPIFVGLVFYPNLFSNIWVYLLKVFFFRERD